MGLRANWTVITLTCRCPSCHRCLRPCQRRLPRKNSWQALRASTITQCAQRVFASRWLLRRLMHAATAMRSAYRRLWVDTPEELSKPRRQAAQQPMRCLVCHITVPGHPAPCANCPRLRRKATVRTGLDALVAVLHEEVPHSALRLPVAVLQGGRKYLRRDAQLADKCRSQISLRSDKASTVIEVVLKSRCMAGDQGLDPHSLSGLALYLDCWQQAHTRRSDFDRTLPGGLPSPC